MSSPATCQGCGLEGSVVCWCGEYVTCPYCYGKGAFRTVWRTRVECWRCSGIGQVKRTEVAA